MAPSTTAADLERRLSLAHQARRAKEAQLDGIRRALCDVGIIEDDDPYSHADLEDVIRQVHEPAVTVDDLARALDNSTPYPVELDMRIYRFMAERLLEMLDTVTKNPDHGLWQPEEAPPEPAPEPEDPPEPIAAQFPESEPQVKVWTEAARRNGDLYAGAENQRDTAREQRDQLEAAIRQVLELCGDHGSDVQDILRPAIARLEASKEGRKSWSGGYFDPDGRPTDWHGIPFRYDQMVTAGWHYCDGCRTWTQATQESPHDCPATYMRGPVTAEAPEFSQARDGSWTWRCNGGPGCEGWVGLELFTEAAARREYQRHVDREHKEQRP